MLPKKQTSKKTARISYGEIEMIQQEIPGCY